MAWFRCGGGEVQQASGGSVILATNPTVTLTKTSNNSVTITWAKPSSEVTIAKYQVYKYKSTTAPTSLSQMTLVGSTTNLTYSVENLDVPSTYFFVVTTVTSDDYENASVKSRQWMKFSNTCFVAKTSTGVFASDDLITWTDVTAAAGNPKYISYADGEFYTDGAYFSENGYTWIERPLPTIETGPYTSSNKATSMGALIGSKATLGINTMNGTTFFIPSTKYDTGYEKVTDSYHVYSNFPQCIWWNAYGYHYVTNISSDSNYNYVTDFRGIASIYTSANRICSNGGYITYLAGFGGTNKYWKVYKHNVKGGSSQFSIIKESKSEYRLDDFIVINNGNGTGNDILVVLSTKWGGNSSLYVSLDSGTTWIQKTLPDIGYLLFYASSKDVLYIVSNYSASKIYSIPVSYMIANANSSTWKFDEMGQLSGVTGVLSYIIGK